MDNVQLHYILDLRRRQRRHVGSCVVDARGRAVLVWISVPRSVATNLMPKQISRRQALTAIALGNVIIGAVMVLNGTIGARLHIPFPVLNRSSFGFWLSYFSVISRVVLALFWFGVQTTIGAECVYQARHRSFSHSRISHGRHPRC